MHKLAAAWREIGRDFGWLILALIFVYGAVSTIVNWQSQNLWLFGENSRRLIALVLWLTIIAVTTPGRATPIPVKQPLPELTYLVLWGIAIAGFVIYFPGLASAAPRWTWNIYAIQAAYVLGNIVLAILFASIFKYSPLELGIHLKHWRLYLSLMVLAFPTGWYLLWWENSNRHRYAHYRRVVHPVSYQHHALAGMGDDLKSLRPYALPILLCSLVTVGIAWARGNETALDLVAMPFRAFSPGTMIQGAGPEEFFYRVGWQTRLASFMPFGWASLVQGIAFDASHIPQGLVAGSYLPSEIPWQFFTGIANALAGGYFWLRSRNLPATILFHLAVFI